MGVSDAFPEQCIPVLVFTRDNTALLPAAKTLQELVPAHNEFGVLCMGGTATRLRTDGVNNPGLSMRLCDIGTKGTREHKNRERVPDCLYPVESAQFGFL